MFQQGKEQEINDLIALHIMGWAENDRGRIGVWKIDKRTKRRHITGFNPAVNLKHACIAADEIGLFKNHCVHQMLGNISPLFRWCVSEIGPGGKKTKIIMGETRAIAISLATLKVKNII